MLRRTSVLMTLMLLVPFGQVATAASAPDSPPPTWCGTPEPDAAENKGSIPYYAIKCTLDEIVSQSNGRVSVDVIGESTQGRSIYAVTLDARGTAKQRRNSDRYQKLEKIELKNPAKAKRMLRGYGNNVKTPIFYNANIHGNEIESTDASIRFIREVGTTPYGKDPRIDQVLDHGLLVFNVTANPDGRVLGQRGNANKIDMNRDYLTQSQPEVRAAVSAMRDLHPVLTVDQHGYYNPTEVDGETFPHSPGMEYDLIMPFNQGRVLRQKAALEELGYPVQIPRLDWCATGGLPDTADGLCPDGSAPNPSTAQGFDDFGPFYGATYGQLTGLDATTPEMCGSNVDPVSGCKTLPNAPEDTPTGAVGSELNAYTNIWSSVGYVMDNHTKMFAAKLESFRRGRAGEARRVCCEAPFDGGEHNWATKYPAGYMIPVGRGERSHADVVRLVDYLLFNEIEVSKLVAPAKIAGRRYDRGSYVVSMKQPLRGLASTMLGLGGDISDRIDSLYGPPAAWSRSAVWGATVHTVPAGKKLASRTKVVKRAPATKGGVRDNGRVYSLAPTTPAAIKAVNKLLRRGVKGKLTERPVKLRESAKKLPAGTMLFPRRARRALEKVGREFGVLFQGQRPARGSLPTKAVPALPRVAQVLPYDSQNRNSTTGGPMWALRQMGFDANQVYSDRVLSDADAPDPLKNFDVVYVAQGAWPKSATAQSRLKEFFARGGGYIGSGKAGNDFVGESGAAEFVGGALETGVSGNGESGLFRWRNSGRTTSPITGGYAGTEMMLMEPITWFNETPTGATVDARLAKRDYFVAGFFPNPRPASAAGAPVYLHGQSTAGGSSRFALFASDPLYRGDPERVWGAFASGVYWSAAKHRR